MTFLESGIASWYGREEQGKPTANGERFDRHAFTAASRHLPFNTIVRVTNEANGRSVQVRINDRGPWKRGRILDLSEAAADTLHMRTSGTAPVTVGSGGTGVGRGGSGAMSGAIRPANPDELFDVVDHEDHVLGQAPRHEVHAKGWLHRATHVIVHDAEGRIYLQKRSPAKDTFPGCWDSSCSGHLDAGEDYAVAARRELGEELGCHGMGLPLRPLVKLAAGPRPATSSSRFSSSARTPALFNSTPRRSRKAAGFPWGSSKTGSATDRTSSLARSGISGRITARKSSRGSGCKAPPAPG